MANILAPIALFVYNRPWHTEQTLQALMLNILALESTLYIFADGPKVNADNDMLARIAEVRALIYSKQWCKEVIVVESPGNKGLADSIKTGVTEVIEKHDQVIVMEDDLITSPAFLSYMNEALAYYENRKSVFSIGGYNMPPNMLQIPPDYEYDVYVGLRNDSWGWATWKDRWNQVDWSASVYSSLLKNIQMQEAFNRGGDDVFEMLQMQQSGKLNIWSIQFTLAHFVNHAVSILPVVSYVDNLGLDGTGENSGISYTHRNAELCTNQDLKFLDILYEDKRILNAFYSANCRNKRPLWKKMINRLSRMLGGENVFVIKKKIYC